MPIIQPKIHTRVRATFLGGMFKEFTVAAEITAIPLQGIRDRSGTWVQISNTPNLLWLTYTPFNADEDSGETFDISFVKE